MEQNLSGFNIDEYIILEQVAEGGMGQIYRALNPNGDGFVALKTLSQKAFTRREYRERFRREIEALKHLSHPHILPIHDYGYYHDMPYFVMPFVEEGRTLRDYIDQWDSLSPNQTLRLAQEIGSALAYAHESGIIHRDVKPSNLMIGKTGDYYLADFGLVKFVDDELTNLTFSILGTAAYMSPEQAKGDSFDHRSDIYSFGLTLYESLLGHLPFNAETNLAMLKQHRHGTPIKPSEITPDFPPELEKLLLNVLCKNPTERYQTINELVNHLELIITDLPNQIQEKPLVTINEIHAADDINNFIDVDDTISFAGGLAPVLRIPEADGDESKRRRPLLALILIGFGVILAGLMLNQLVISPLRDQLSKSELTAQALQNQNPLIITQFVTQAGQDALSFSEEITPTATGTPTPTLTPTSTSTETIVPNAPNVPTASPTPDISSPTPDQNGTATAIAGVVTPDNESVQSTSVPKKSDNATDAPGQSGNAGNNGNGEENGNAGGNGNGGGDGNGGDNNGKKPSK